jgi:hypothetical protein
MSDMDRLDRLLREDARMELADNGFGARVLIALPPRAVPQGGWLKPTLILGSAALGSVLAAAFTPSNASAFQGFIDLAQLRGLTPAVLSCMALAGALLVSALVLAADAD